MSSPKEIDGEHIATETDQQQQQSQTSNTEETNEMGIGTEFTITEDTPEKTIFSKSDIRYHLRSNKTKQDILQELEDGIVPRGTGPWGDPLEELDEAHFRVYFQNVRGLSFDKEGNEFGITFDDLQATNADFFGLAETNMDWGQRNVRGMAHRWARQTFTHTSVQTSTSSIRSKYAHK